MDESDFTEYDEQEKVSGYDITNDIISIVRSGLVKAFEAIGKGIDRSERINSLSTESKHEVYYLIFSCLMHEMTKKYELHTSACPVNKHKSQYSLSCQVSEFGSVIKALESLQKTERTVEDFFLAKTTDEAIKLLIYRLKDKNNTSDDFEMPISWDAIKIKNPFKN